MRADLQTICDNYMNELLDLYNRRDMGRDWEMGLVEFLEKATEVTLDTIGSLQSKILKGEE